MNLDEIKARADLKRWPTMAELGQYREDQKALVAEIERLRVDIHNLNVDISYERETGTPYADEEIQRRLRGML